MLHRNWVLQLPIYSTGLLTNTWLVHIYNLLSVKMQRTDLKLSRLCLPAFLSRRFDLTSDTVLSGSSGALAAFPVWVSSFESSQTSGVALGVLPVKLWNPLHRTKPKTKTAPKSIFAGFLHLSLAEEIGANDGSGCRCQQLQEEVAEFHPKSAKSGLRH